jgi:hypothetical protein
MRAKEFLPESRQPRIGYHVTRTANLPNIRKQGIKPDSRGNSYFWDSLEMAEWFSDFQNDNDEDRTIITLDTSGLPMTVDDEATDMSEWSSSFQPGTRGGAWIVKGGISPDRIRGN